MRRLSTIIALLLGFSATVIAQESHYHKALRSAEEGAVEGLVGLGDSHVSGMTNGIYWSRVRNADDVAIKSQTPAEASAHRQAFLRFYNMAFDAYVVGDHYRTLLYGDSALQEGLETADLHFYMAIAYEKQGAYREAQQAYRHSMRGGYYVANKAYKEFKARQKMRQKAQQEP